MPFFVLYPDSIMDVYVIQEVFGVSFSSAIMGVTNPALRNHVQAVLKGEVEEDDMAFEVAKLYAKLSGKSHVYYTRVTLGILLKQCPLCSMSTAFQGHS